MNLDFELVDYAMQLMPGVAEALDAAGIDGQRADGPPEADAPFHHTDQQIARPIAATVQIGPAAPGRSDQY